MNGRNAKDARGRIAAGIDGTCPVCRRVYAVSIPAGGDGSAGVLRRHRRGTVPCLGSRQIRVEDER